MSQSLSLWLSVIATIISVSSFLLNLKNTRRTQKLDALQRRTQLLVKLNEARLKVNTASVELRKLEWALSELKSSLPLNDEFNSFFAKAEGILLSNQNEVANNIKDIEEVRSNLDTATAMADASKIEKILPKVDNVISQSNIVLNHINAAMGQIEVGKKKLQSSNPTSKAAT